MVYLRVVGWPGVGCLMCGDGGRLPCIFASLNPPVSNSVASISMYLCLQVVVYECVSMLVVVRQRY